VSLDPATLPAAKPVAGHVGGIAYAGSVSPEAKDPPVHAISPSITYRLSS
jgi:hypothetical protein